jgi:hypothetical protein
MLFLHWSSFSLVCGKKSVSPEPLSQRASCLFDCTSFLPPQSHTQRVCQSHCHLANPIIGTTSFTLLHYKILYYYLMLALSPSVARSLPRTKSRLLHVWTKDARSYCLPMDIASSMRHMSAAYPFVVPALRPPEKQQRTRHLRNDLNYGMTYSLPI